jgi:hypothetical protein
MAPAGQITRVARNLFASSGYKAFMLNLSRVDEMMNTRVLNVFPNPQSKARREK